WRQLIGAGPSPRGGSAITYHQGRQEVLLFGGGDTIIGPGALHDDMWAWDGATWREIPSATSPGSRIFSNMVYVPRDDRILLTGGLGPGWRGDHDTWAWDGEAWHKLLKTGPSPRMRHSAVYDTVRRETLIINGARGPAPIREIWAWNGQEWAIRHQGGGPPEHVHNGAAFDQARGELVYFGGSTTSGTTWTWNGHMWSAHSIPGP